MDKHKGSYVGIGHTRWATCGAKTDANSHPHLDNSNRIALVHNGTLDNIASLKEELKQAGIELRSETDSELIVQFIGKYVAEGMSLWDATQKTLKDKLVGTWGLAILDR